MSATNTACGSKLASAALAAAFFAGCGGAPVKTTAPKPVLAPVFAPPPPPPPDANVELIVSEAVSGPDEDTASFTKIFVDGKEAGKTPVGPRSQKRNWAGRVEPGNHLFRFEQWYLPPSGEWNALDAQWQPPERFIRVDASGRATAALKFRDGGRRFELGVTRTGPTP